MLKIYLHIPDSECSKFQSLLEVANNNGHRIQQVEFQKGTYNNGPQDGKVITDFESVINENKENNAIYVTNNYQIFTQLLQAGYCTYLYVKKSASETNSVFPFEEDIASSVSKPSENTEDAMSSSNGNQTNDDFIDLEANYQEITQNNNAEFLCNLLTRVMKKNKNNNNAPNVKTGFFQNTQANNQMPPEHQQFIDAFATLAKEMGSDTKSYHWAWGFIAIILAAGGTFPFVIFNGDYFKKLLGDKKFLQQFLIIWGIIMSGVVNINITFNSMNDFDLVFQLKAISEKIISQKNLDDSVKNNRALILLAALAILLVNVGSFYSNKELAEVTTKDFSKRVYNNSIMNKFLVIFQIIGATALVIRATISKPESTQHKDQEMIAMKLKFSLISLLNELLSKEQRINNDADLILLAQGKTLRKNYTPLKIALFITPALLTLLYSGAFGGAAWTAVKTGKIGMDLWGAFTTGTSFISKAALLEFAAWKVSGKLTEFLAKVLGHSVLDSECELSITETVTLSASLGFFVVAPTWGSAGDITQKFLIGKVGPHLGISAAIQNMISSIVGIGGALPINYSDTHSIIIKLIETYRKRQPNTSADEFIKKIMKHIATMPAKNVCWRYAEEGDVETGNLDLLRRVDSDINALCGVVSNARYENTCAAIIKLLELVERCGETIDRTQIKAWLDLYYRASHGDKTAINRLANPVTEHVIDIRDVPASYSNVQTQYSSIQTA